MPGWKPAYNNYHQVRCSTTIGFVIRDGTIMVNYRH
jgi:hypothetical protein